MQACTLMIASIRSLFHSQITQLYAFHFDVIDNHLYNGGSVEVFNNATDAEARYTYVEEVNKVMSAFTQYLYLSDNILLRVDGDLTPEQAEEYRTAFEALINA